MRRIFLTVIMVMASVSVSAAAVFNSEKEFENFMTYYYRDPQPEKVIAALSYYVNSPLYKDSGSRMSLAHFFAYILKSEPAILEQYYERQNNKGTTDSRIFALNVLWLINNKSSLDMISKAEHNWKDRQIQKIIMNIHAASVYDVLKGTPRTPAELNNLWGIFLATGNELAVKKVISVLPFKEKSEKKDILLGAAAQWSLASNAIQHEKVLGILKHEQKFARGTVKKLLKQMIENAQIQNQSPFSM